MLKQLKLIPCRDWSEGLLIGEAENKGRIMIDGIDQIVNSLHK